MSKKIIILGYDSNEVNKLFRENNLSLDWLDTNRFWSSNSIICKEAIHLLRQNNIKFTRE